MSNITWRPEPVGRAIPWDDLWIAEKFQSNLAIAGSRRNSFWASLVTKLQVVEHCKGSSGLVSGTLANSEYLQSIHGSQNVGAKLHAQEGNSPDHNLRSPNLT